MARWKAVERPSEPVRKRASARDRLRLIEEREEALRALPVDVHGDYLREFYKVHQGWPFSSSQCRCVVPDDECEVTDEYECGPSGA